MKTEPFEISVGQEVVLLPTGNFQRSWDGKPVPGRIFKITREYFYVSVNGHTWEDERFDRGDFSCDKKDRNGGYVIYENEEAFRKAVEYECMLLEVRRFFSGRQTAEVPYDVLKEIHGLLSYEDLI